MQQNHLLDHLEKLIAAKAVADTGSIHAASRLLRIAQPSLSAKIRALEEALGVAMFVRSSRGASLTREGELLVELARRIVREVSQTHSALRSLSGAPSGVVTVGLYESVARYWWPQFLRRFSTQHRDIKTPLHTARSPELIERLRQGSIDVALSVEPPDSPDLENLALYVDNFCIYGARRLLSRWAVRPKSGIVKLSPEQLGEVPLFVFSEALGEGGTPLRASLRTNGIGGAIEEIASFEVALEFARQGLGAAVLPGRVAQQLWESDVLVKFDLTPVWRAVEFGAHRVFTSTLRSRSHDPVIGEVVRAIVEHVQDAPPVGRKRGK